MEFESIQTLDLPRGSVQRNQGFAIDFGNSALKIAYALPVDDKVRLHFVSFLRERKDEAFQFIKDKVGDYLEPGQEICLTGLGANQFKEELEGVFNIRVDSVLGVDCIVDGFLYLVKHVSSRELLHPPSEEVQVYDKTTVESLKGITKLIASMPGSRLKPSPIMTKSEYEPWTKDDIFPDVIEYPALLCICGSAARSLYVDADGKYEALDVLPICKQTLLGAGSMLAGVKTFEELMALAVEGHAGSVDTISNQVAMESHGEDEVYSKMKVEVEIPTFLWGNAIGKDISDFTRADKAAACVTLIANNLATWSQISAAQLKKRHVYFCGELLSNNRRIRDETHKVFAKRASLQYDGIRSNAHFMKLGAYLGSLGCLLANLKTPTE